MKKVYTIIVMLLTIMNGMAQICFEVKQIGGIGIDRCTSSAIDAAGNLYTSGVFSNTVDFDPGPGVDSRTSSGNFDAYLCKFSALGDLMWVRTWGGSMMDRADGLALDNYNHIYVCGPYQSIVDFDPGSGTDLHTSNAGTMNNPYISMFDTAGNYIWVRTWGTINGGSEAYSCATDKSGNVYAVGDFHDLPGVAIDFDPGIGVDNHYINGIDTAINFDAWLVKYDSMGNYLWGKNWGRDLYDDGPSVAVDDGGVYDAGMFMSQNADFDPDSVTTDIHSSHGNIDVFVNKFDLNGKHLWARTWGGTGADDAGHIIADNAGHIYIAGYFADTVDFDPGAGVFNLIGNTGIDDIFLSKLDTSGNFIWAESMGGTGEDKAFPLTSDGNGNLYFSGIFSDTADFDPGPGVYNLISAGAYDIYICKIDTAGNMIWAKSMGGPGDDRGSTISIAGNGDIYLGGDFSATADLDPENGIFNLTSLGNTDIYIEKLFACPTYIDENSNRSNSLMIYPNPASDNAVISVVSESKTNPPITIYNMQGETIFRSGLNGSQAQIDVRAYPKGIYMVKVVWETKVESAKLIIN
jgi:hypothetical protein